VSCGHATDGRRLLRVLLLRIGALSTCPSWTFLLLICALLHSNGDTATALSALEGATDLSLIGALFGHRDVATARYAHLIRERQQHAAEATAGAVAAALVCKVASPVRIPSLRSSNSR
jgi:hypothetical protein